MLLLKEGDSMTNEAGKIPEPGDVLRDLNDLMGAVIMVLSNDEVYKRITTQNPGVIEANVQEVDRQLATIDKTALTDNERIALEGSLKLLESSKKRRGM